MNKSWLLGLNGNYKGFKQLSYWVTIAINNLDVLTAVTNLFMWI